MRVSAERRCDVCKSKEYVWVSDDWDVGLTQDWTLEEAETRKQVVRLQVYSDSRVETWMATEGAVPVEVVIEWARKLEQLINGGA